MSTFVHPETGEVLESRQDFLNAIQSLEHDMQPFWRLRRQLRDGLADRFPAPELPRPRERTTTQEKVARCPRCGSKLTQTEEE